MQKSFSAVALAATLAFAAASGFGWAQSTAPPAVTPQKNVNDWLLNAPDDTARFKLLQTYLRGFDQPMWEVGERYQAIYDALGDKNFELAEYHWDKIKVTIVNGYLKRPKRQDNSDSVFVKNIWDDVNRAFLSKDPQKAWDGFALTRQACMSCHEAEKVAFMNNMPLFRRTEKAPGK
jgi:hypothetical protein